MDENEEVNEQQQSSMGQQVVERGKQEVKQRTEKMIKEQAKKKMQEQAAKEAAKQAAKTAATTASKSSLLAAAGPVLFWVLVVIVAIIIIVGIIMFFMTVPGMVLEQLKSFASDLADAIGSFFGWDSTKQIDEQEIYDVLNYLEEMGYDLKGYGFISKNADETHANYDESQGVIRDPDTGKIMDIDPGGFFTSGVREAHSEIISLYIMSDNYVYTVKNFNNVSNWWEGVRWIEGLWQHIKGVFTDNTEWGKGLISIYREDGGELGSIGSDYSNGIFSWNDISVDPQNKKLSIRRGWGNNYFEYSLDGWVGRYGMPLEFLLSVHIATMKPDLASEMISEFETDVQILLRSVDAGSVEAAYQTNSGAYVKFSEVSNAIYSGRSGEGVLDWFDDWNLSLEEKNKLFDIGFDHAEGADCACELNEETGEYDVVSSGCTDRIKAILDKLKNTNDYNFETFVPYLSRVTNHWFRDVYFVLSAEEAQNTRLTRIDLDYEKITNERWTLYEKYESGAEAGNYVLYKYDETKEDGIGEKYFNDADGDGIRGTQLDADEEDIKVVKRQEETYIADLIDEEIATDDDLSDGWTAYKDETTSSEQWEPAYLEPEDEIEERIFYKVKLPSSVVQKDDGVRGVTNAQIKDMFLNRYYFSYDGTGKTADIIKQVRDELGMQYGQVDEANLDNEYQVEVKEDGKTITENVKVRDIVSNVSITQDSLAAFSMLENTHTKDADFIYKDFKELIVELGYFTKEDLSDGNPKLLQWIIPEIESVGYPKRELDKKENEYGTLLHSKEDYEINQKNTIAELMANAESLTEPPEGAGEEQDNQDGYSLKDKNFENRNVLGSVATLNYTPMSMLIAVGSIKEVPEANYTVTPVSNSGTGVKTADLEVNGVNYEVWRQTDSTCTLYSFAFMATAYTGKPFEEYVTTSSGAYINKNGTGQGGNSFWLQGAGVMWDPIQNEIGGEYYFPGDSTIGEKVSTALSEGKPVYFYGDYKASAGYHAVVLLGAAENGVLIYNPGGGTVEIYKSGSSFSSSLLSLLNTHFKHRIFIPDTAPEGVQNTDGYQGYKGNEAVVSPVTGILLDYGTYTDDDIDSATNEPYRKNSDAPQYTDQVGYAKILVLNEEIADQLVDCDKHNSKGKITVNTPESLDDMGGWSDEQKALYGYSLFAEEYEYGNIAGYVIFIDGFKCNLPGEAEEDENGQIEITEEGQELSMDYFKQNAAQGSFTECKYEETLYQPDKLYNLISEKIEDKQEAKIEAKDIAAPLYSFTGSIDDEMQELLVIKEGTVIGRTLTDKELVEEYRGEEYKTKEEATETVTNPDGTTEEVDTREVRGNYLRIIMRDLDDTVVENVEDYMKLEEGTTSISDWELFFWLPFESGGTDVEGNGPESQGSCSDGETAVGIIQWTVLNDMNNIKNQFIPGCLEENPTLCAPLSAYASWSSSDFWNDYSSGTKQFQATLSQICEVDRDAFLQVQMEVAKKQYLVPLLTDYPWLENRPACVQGVVMHLRVWGASTDWLSGYENATDEEIVKKVRNTIANTPSTAGPASGDETSGRAYNEPEIALRILNGELSTKEIEQWVRNSDASILPFDLK